VSTAAVTERSHEVVPPARLPARRVNRCIVGLSALTVVAAAVRFVGLAHQSYWFDEADTVAILHTSLGGLLARVPGWETTPPLYFILAWLWVHVFGYGEAGLRSLSALAGVITVPVAYAAGAELFSRRVGLIVAALTACNPLLVWYSQEARSYALLVLLTSVALLAFAHLRIRPTPRWMVTWAVAAALALATHYYAALAIVPEGILLLARYRSIRLVRTGVIGIAVCCLPLVLLAIRQLGNLGISSWINRVPLLQRIGDVPKAFAIGPNAPGGQWLVLASAIAVGISAGLTARRANRHERRSILFVARLVAGGFGIVIALIVFKLDQLNTRNMLALWLPVALVISGGLGVRRAGAIGPAGAVVLCTVGLATVIGVAVDPWLQRPAWRSVARALRSTAERAVFTINGCQLLPLSLYVPGLQFAPPTGTVVTEIDVIAVANQTSWYDVTFSGWYTVCKPQRRSVAIPRQLGSFRASGRPVRINQFSVLRLTSDAPVRVTQRMFSAAGLRGALMVAHGDRSQPTGGSASP